MFSKRHYEFLARWIASDIPDGPARRKVANTLTERLAAQEPKFNRSKFLRACELGLWKTD